MKRRCPVCYKMSPSYLFDSHVRQCRKAREAERTASKADLRARLTLLAKVSS